APGDTPPPAPPSDAPDMAAIGDAATGIAETEDGPEKETFFTFTWGGRPARGAKPQGQRPQGKGRPKKGAPKGGGDKPQKFAAKPKAEKRIDPDNPFAAALADFNKK
ncbi:MAG: disulfide oxidoreductase, partial [Loktanella sp.]|nr:disulfide oxidoreductase [Loktanella sp.]